MKNVLVTGANGHVGSNLVRLLIEKGYNVRASVRDLEDVDKVKPLKQIGAHVVEADLMKPETLYAAMQGVDGLFQVAAVYTLWSPNPQNDIIDPSVVGGFNALRAAHESGVKKIVFTSSAAAIGVHGTLDKPLTEEDWNNEALTPYMVAKTEAEKRAWEYANDNDLDMVTICPTAIIGPGFYRHTPSTEVFEFALRGKLKAVLPLGFSFVDVRDVAEAHRLAYENNSASGRYLVADQFCSMMNLLKVIHKCEPSIPVPSLTLPTPALYILNFFDWLGHTFTGRNRQITGDIIKEFAGKEQRVSTKKIRTELGWKPMDFEESVKDTLDWVRKIFLDTDNV